MESHRALAYVVAGCAVLQWIACSAAQGPSGSTGPGGGGGASSSSASVASVSASTAKASSSAASGGQGGGGSGPCAGDADCAAQPDNPRCDKPAGVCVQCLPSGDNCAMGTFCNPTLSCQPGCKADADCSMNMHCTAQHSCVQCIGDADCAVGSVCVGGACAPGCSNVQSCPAGLTCCGNACVDPAKNVNDCGVCGNLCAPPPNATPICVSGECGLGGCVNPFEDCDLDPANGCEENTLQDGPCKCTPGTQTTCYQGAPGTLGVGPCHAGIQICDADGLAFGACTGQVLPSADVCNNGIDDDCNGAVDDGADNDGDGWRTCQGDCCDDPAKCPIDPKLINPGAFEILGNGVDDDCDASTSDAVPPAACSTMQNFAGVTAVDVAKAMDICQFTTLNPPIAQKKWGVITADQLLAAGTVPTPAQLANMQNWQTAILQDYGAVLPMKGATMAGIMSGKMRDVDDPGYVPPNNGTDFGTTSLAPVVFLNAHGGQLPASQGCSGACVAGTGANDSVDIRLSIRVPTNANAFSYKFKFYTAEYWGFSCSVYNDFFLALLKTGAPGIPADTNISFDALGNPVSVNNGFFSVCQAKGCYACPSGTAPLVGTGMDQMACYAGPGCGSTGGGTNWLTTSAPVVPGETMILDLMVFDVTGHILDSLALLDDFEWSAAPSQVVTHE